MKTQVFNEIRKWDAAGLKALNDSLRFLFKHVRGGITLRDLDSEVRLEFATASSLDTKNGIVINEKGVDISAGGGSQYLRITPDIIEATDIQSPTVSPRYAGARVLTVKPEASSEEMAGESVYRSLSDALATINGRQVEGTVRIDCTEGAVMYGNIGISGICGGEIEIIGAGAKVVGNVTISGSNCILRILNMSIAAAEGAAMAVSGAGQMVVITGCSISSQSGDAVEAAHGAHVSAVDCTLISIGGRAAYIRDTAFGAFEGCIGKGALTARKAALSAVGTVPDGGCIDAGGAFISAADVIPTGADGEPAVPETMTAEYAMLHSDSYAAGRSFRNWAYPDNQDDDIRQGYTEYSGLIRGCIWFDNDVIRTQLAGRTIKQASLRLYAMKGVGRGVAVSVELHGTNMEYAGRSGEPELTKSYGVIGSVTPGEVTNITIPTQAIDDLVGGTISALMLYSADNTLYKDRAYSRDYARFAGETSGTADTVPVLTVVTEGRKTAAAICGEVLCGQVICGEE